MTLTRLTVSGLSGNRQFFIGYLNHTGADNWGLYIPMHKSIVHKAQSPSPTPKQPSHFRNAQSVMDKPYDIQCTYDMY